ncbi:hypothetical protein EC951288_4609B, partial [Escherichia coli 95.1288]
ADSLLFVFVNLAMNAFPSKVKIFSHTIAAFAHQMHCF